MSQGDPVGNDRQAQPRLHPRQPPLPRQDLSTAALPDAVDGALDLQHLRRKGYLAIPGVLDLETAALLVRECEQAIDDGEAAGYYHGSERGVRTLGEIHRRAPRVMPLLGEARILEALRSVLGTGPIKGTPIYRSPQPGYEGQNLHTDGRPPGPDGFWTGATIIVALCPFTEDNGATAVLPLHGPQPDLRGGVLPSHPDEVVMTGEAGTAFVFGKHVLHRGRRNNSSEPRPALQILWTRSYALW